MEEEATISGSVDSTGEPLTPSRKGKKTTKLVELPATYGRDRSASDKKWKFVDEDQSEAMMSQSAPAFAGGPMYFAAPPPVFVARRPAGEAPGDGARKVEEIQLQAGVFMAKLYTFGAALTQFCIPDQWGNPTDVLCGLGGPEDCYVDTSYVGSTIGRVADRISGAAFSAGGESYSLAKNDGAHAVHGGMKGWDKVVWEVANVDSSNCCVTLAYTSPDGEEGFPGKVEATITFSLNFNGCLRIDYAAQVSGKASPVNMVHQLFWNLAGHNAGAEAAKKHAISIGADKYTPVDADGTPTGEQSDISGTAFDLRETKTLEMALEAHSDEGFEQYLVLSQLRAPGMENAELHFAGSLQDVSGRYMEVHTSAPGVHFQTKLGDGDAAVKGKDSTPYGNNAGICLRTQSFPDAVNKPDFPTAMVEDGEWYSHAVEFRFFC